MRLSPGRKGAELGSSNGQEREAKGNRPPWQPPPPAATTVSSALPPAASSGPSTPAHVHRAPLLRRTKLLLHTAWVGMAALIGLGAAVVQLQDSALFAPLFTSVRVSHVYGLQEPPLLMWVEHDGRPYIGGVESIIPLHLTSAHTRPLVVESISVDFGAYDLGEVATEVTGQPPKYRHGTLRGSCDHLKLAATRNEIEKAISHRASEAQSYPFSVEPVISTSPSTAPFHYAGVIPRWPCRSIHQRAEKRTSFLSQCSLASRISTASRKGPPSSQSAPTFGPSPARYP